MIIQIIRQLDFNLAYAKKLVEDLSDEQMTVTSCIGFENHPSMDEKSLTEKIQWRFNNYFPSISDLALFMCVNHEAMHLGQLAAWRRAMKLPGALGEI